VLLAPAATVLPLRIAFLARAVLCLIPHRSFTRRFLYWLFEDLVRKDAAGRRAVDEGVAGMVLAARCFKPTRGVWPTVLKDADFAALRVPTLYVVGEHEQQYSAQQAVQRLTKVAPDIKTAIIPDAGHDLTFVQAGLVTRTVLAFLQQP
jgi:pimeloyl-ACP methyl ester carboxylesterase